MGLGFGFGLGLRLGLANPNPNPIPNPNPDPSPTPNQALGRLGAKHPQWVDAEGLSARLVPMLDDADRIVRASAALAVGMLKLQAGAEKLCLLWRNDPISHVRDAALTAMKSVGGPLIEDKLRIEKVLSTHCSHKPDPDPNRTPTPTPNQVLSTHCSNFRAELERKSYQAAEG